MDLTNQEYYVIFKRVYENLILSEFTLEKMNVFKEKLIYLLKKLADSSNPSDIILLPTIFLVLKRSFYKIKKETMIMLKQINSKNINDSFSNMSCDINKGGEKNSNKNNRNEDNYDDSKNNHTVFKYKNKNEKRNFLRNGELILKSIKVCCNFLDVNIHEDISFSALNYIFRFFEEPLHFQYDNKIHVVYKSFNQLFLKIT